MAYDTHPATAPTQHEVGVHFVTWTVGVLGLIAAAIGVWFATVEEGTLTLFSRTYERSDLADSWAPILMILGGGAAAIGLTIQAIRDFGHAENYWLVGIEAVLAAVGIAAVVMGIILLF